MAIPTEMDRRVADVLYVVAMAAVIGSTHANEHLSRRFGRQAGKSGFTSFMEPLEHLAPAALLCVIGVQHFEPGARRKGAIAPCYGRLRTPRQCRYSLSAVPRIGF
jgi:hypothetical protein